MYAHAQAHIHDIVHVRLLHIKKISAQKIKAEPLRWSALSTMATRLPNCHETREIDQSDGCLVM